MWFWGASLFESVSPSCMRLLLRTRPSPSRFHRCRLLLDTDRGAIDVRLAERSPRLEVAVRDATGIPVECTQRGPDVQIHGKATRGFWHWSWWKFWRSLEFVVTVPRQYHMDLSTSGGAISEGDLEGEVRNRTSGGSIHLGPIHGPVWGEMSGEGS